MKYLNYFIIYENLQQANSLVEKGLVDEKIVEFLKDKFTNDISRPNYIGIFSKKISRINDFDFDFEKFKKYINKFIELINKNFKFDVSNLDLWGFYKKVDDSFIELKINKILKNYVPSGNIRREIKNNVEIYNKLYDLVRNDRVNVDHIGNKAISIRSADELLHFIEYEGAETIVKSIKNDKQNYNIIKETENYLFYHQKNYDPDHKFKNTNWCTFIEDQWDNYTRGGNDFYFLFDKNDAKNSIVALHNKKQNKVQYFDYFDRSANDSNKNLRISKDIMSKIIENI